MTTVSSIPIAVVTAGDLIGELAALAALKQERLKRPKFYPRSATGCSGLYAASNSRSLFTRTLKRYPMGTLIVG